ncbi:ABC transporter ATP-binding protein [Amycolatopsis sp. GM8]|uniref:ABC transporter ATP-binding protein n=1 Tax=Amycolatopsis sp. GM8 TaxID=2896530 RepID=UPI001F46860E|nr:ABC transporter ATP-binding protein [Amycolatopsis sp. GM8]
MSQSALSSAEHSDEKSAVTPALEARNLSAGYGKTTVLRDISFSVAPGSILAVLGPNGAGKTTLLRTLIGLIRPSTGEILVNGRAVTNTKPYQRRKLGVCLVPEGRGIYRSLTVRENLRLHTWRGNEKEAIERTVEHFPILGRKLNQAAGLLSGGQQQMLAVIRAYIDNPALVFVDEVSMGLAPLVIDEIYEFLGMISREGTSLVLVEQYVHRALAAADQVMIISRGQSVFKGAPGEVGDEVFAHYLDAGAPSTTDDTPSGED